MINSFKNFISRSLKKMGYEIRKRSSKTEPDYSNPKLTFEFDYEPSTDNRPIGDINTFLHDIRKRGLKLNYVFDIGANKSEYSRMVKKIFPDADFLLIDPIEEMEPHLKEFCREFRGSEYILKGIGSRQETLIMTTIGESFEGSTLMLNEIPSFKSANKQREVEVVTLDSIMKNGRARIPELVKIDVQGFELEVLKGSTLLYGKTEMFILEISLFRFNEKTPDIVEILKFMDEKGYEVYDITGFLRRPYDGALAQLDICFVRKDSFLKETIKWK